MKSNKDDKSNKRNKSFPVQYVSTPYALIKRYDLTTAAIYGYIWSKQQLSKGYCCTSQETIGRDIGVTPRTVYTKMQNLIEDDFIWIIGGGNYTSESGRTLQAKCNENALIELDKDEGIISAKREAKYQIIEGEPAPGQTISDFIIEQMKLAYDS
jgi:hypothetical protein